MRPTFGQFKQEALANPKVALEYERIAAVYALRREEIRMRREAALRREHGTTRQHSK